MFIFAIWTHGCQRWKCLRDASEFINVNHAHCLLNQRRVQLLFLSATQVWRINWSGIIRYLVATQRSAHIALANWLVSQYLHLSYASLIFTSKVLRFSVLHFLVAYFAHGLFVLYFRSCIFSAPRSAYLPMTSVILVEQLMETSSLCSQLLYPKPPCEQASSAFSVPEHWTSSNHIICPSGAGPNALLMRSPERLCKIP